VSDPIYPFRWDVSKRSQLGSLLEIPEEERAEWILRQTYNVAPEDLDPADRSLSSVERFERALSLCCARVLAFCDDSDMYFVGRSPESLFDFLSGILFDTSWESRLTLLHFSASYTSLGEIMSVYAAQLEQLYAYLEQIQLSPRAIAERSRPTAFVDIVLSGHTFGLLINLLHVWSKRTYPDWPAVQRKLRIVGLTERTKTSPKTWRWHQHADWVDMLEPRSVKNVSIPSTLYEYLSWRQSKTTRAYPPRDWGDTEVREPRHDHPTARMALAQAASLFDKGRDKATRRAFVTQMAEQPAMKYPWYRALAQEIAGK
jgi:hypothetical protein